MILKGGVGKLFPPMNLDNFVGGPCSPGSVDEFLWEGFCGKYALYRVRYVVFCRVRRSNTCWMVRIVV